ncbi:MAG: hypothetical protein E6J60_07445 [Deltaproteobacteria bacterium]|nr:MAG: hypothetical protein E6J60_07445 [Deltaproteobacteria bacterium]
MVQISSGAVTKHLACGGLYTGGGSNSVPLPYAVPDMGNSLTALTQCSGTTLTLGNLTSTDTGSNRNCTSVGCLFGPPLPTGESALSLPLTSALFLDGDLFPQSGGMDHCMGGTAAGAVCHARCVGGLNDGSFCTNFCGNAACTAAATPFACCTGAAMGNCDNSNCTAAGTPNACCTGAGTGACNGTCNVFLSGGGSNSDCPGGFCTVGVQACPLCAADGKCHGGDNDGGACTPADSPINSNFPTSQDCPPPAGNNIGSLPIAFALTTGTKTMTSVDQANQPRSFCGFCRDINNQSSGCFAGDQTGACPDPKPAGPVSCNTNADCPAAYPDCQQRNSGAFGPAGGGARTITETGSPAPGLSDGMGHPSTLVSIFCIPPTFNATVDSAGDLPAPGAVALSGTAQLLP